MYKKIGIVGFEPTHKGVKVLCLTAWPYPNKLGGKQDSNLRMSVPQTDVLTKLHHYRHDYNTGIVGIEPTSAVLETVILPLNYIPK